LLRAGARRPVALSANTRTLKKYKCMKRFQIKQKVFKSYLLFLDGARHRGKLAVFCSYSVYKAKIIFSSNPVFFIVFAVREFIGGETSLIRQLVIDLMLKVKSRNTLVFSSIYGYISLIIWR
jgi:hypothetical protein